MEPGRHLSHREPPRHGTGRQDTNPAGRPEPSGGRGTARGRTNRRPAAAGVPHGSGGLHGPLPAARRGAAAVLRPAHARSRGRRRAHGRDLRAGVRVTGDLSRPGGGRRGMALRGGPAPARAVLPQRTRRRRGSPQARHARASRAARGLRPHRGARRLRADPRGPGGGALGRSRDASGTPFACASSRAATIPRSRAPCRAPRSTPASASAAVCAHLALALQERGLALATEAD